MSALTLDQIRDPDCVKSFDPLVFDLTGAYVTGAAAVLRRVLYAITNQRGRLTHARDRGVDIRDFENASLDAIDIAGSTTAIEREARKVDFVRSARATLTLGDNTWILVLTITLVDGGTYPLEVSVGEAATAITSIGAT